MFKHLALAFALTTALAGSALAAIPKDPSIPQIYQAAEAGRLNEAKEMIAKVLQDHPASAKAHFVHSELLLKEGKIAAARSELARAEELAPGLPFAKPETVSSLRRSFEAATVGSDASRAGSGSSSKSALRPMVAQDREPLKAGGGFGLLPIAFLGFGVLAFVVFLIRRAKPTRASVAPTPTGPAPSGNGGYGAPSYPGGYGGGVPQPAPGMPGMQGMPMAQAAPAASGGMGGMGGLGGALMTGAAMGLGAAAVGEAVRRFSHPDSRPERDVSSNVSQQPAFANDLGPTADRDLGGNDFGITDTSSWDNAGSGDSGDGGGTDWDS